jgi:hypothetical protein
MLFLLTPCLPFANTHTSYRIGSDTAGLEKAPSFDEANLYIISMIVHLSIRV